LPRTPDSLKRRFPDSFRIVGIPDRGPLATIGSSILRIPPIPPTCKLPRTPFPAHFGGLPTILPSEYHVRYLPVENLLKVALNHFPRMSGLGIARIRKVKHFPPLLFFHRHLHSFHRITLLQVIDLEGVLPVEFVSFRIVNSTTPRDNRLLPIFPDPGHSKRRNSHGERHYNTNGLESAPALQASSVLPRRTRHSASSGR
jgi:hypothetical protein